MIEQLREAANALAGRVGDESASLSRVRTVGYLLDDSIPIPGTDRRIGLDPLIGLAPVAGDTVAAALSLYIVAEGALMGVPRNVLGKMVLNVAIDTVIGFIPIVGDVFDATWKANQRNVNLIERHADDRGIEVGDTVLDLK